MLSGLSVQAIRVFFENMTKKTANHDWENERIRNAWGAQARLEIKFIAATKKDQTLIIRV